MLLSPFDFSKANSIFSPQEQQFIQDVHTRHSVTVVETYFSLGKHQNSLRVWVDTEKGTTPFVKQLRELLKDNDGPLTWLKHTPEIRSFAKDMMHLYAHHFGIEDIEHTKDIPPDGPHPGCSVYVHEFKSCINARAHSLGVEDIRIALEAQYGMPWRYVLAYYGPKIVAVVQDRKRYERMKADEDTIHDICYQAIKRFDHHGILTKTDIHLEIVFEDDLDAHMHFLYRREIVANRAK